MALEFTFAQDESRGPTDTGGRALRNNKNELIGLLPHSIVWPLGALKHLALRPFVDTRGRGPGGGAGVHNEALSPDASTSFQLNFNLINSRCKR